MIGQNTQCLLASLDNPPNEFQAISINFSYACLAGERQLKN